MYFSALHTRLNSLYACNCAECKTIYLATDKSKNSIDFKNLLKIATRAIKTMHKNAAYNAKNLSEQKEYKDLIDATNNTLKSAMDIGISDNVIPDVMAKKLKNDIFIFSALKTHAQLFEVSRLLTNENGTVKPFYKFEQDVAGIVNNYNTNYLEAEYNFAVSSSQMAAKWADVEANKDRYNLQYRTANDEHVRASHAALHNTTLPSEHEFWNKYYPPNGWRCRCKAIEVLKDKYEVSDAEKVTAEAEKATTQINKQGKNALEIFRFNPGKQAVVFPPKHPYRKVQDADKVEKIAGSLENIKRKKEITESRKLTKKWANKFANNPATYSVNINELNAITISKSNIKTILSKGHDNPIARDTFLRNIEKEIKNVKYVGWAKDEEIDGVPKHPDTKYWKYFEATVAEEKSYINIKVLHKGGEAPYAIENEKDFIKKKIKKGSPKT